MTRTPRFAGDLVDRGRDRRRIRSEATVDAGGDAHRRGTPRAPSRAPARPPPRRDADCARRRRCRSSCALRLRVRQGLHEDRRRGRARIEVTGAALAEVARAALAGDERDGRVPARGGRGEPPRPQRLRERDAAGRRGASGRRPSDGARRTSSCRPARPCPARRPRRARRAKAAAKSAASSVRGRAGAHWPSEEQRAVQRSARAADRRHERHADGLQHAPRVVGSTRARAAAARRPFPRAMFVAVVGVADRRVELGQVGRPARRSARGTAPATRSARRR